MDWSGRITRSSVSIWTFFEQPGRERCKFKILSERFFISPEKLVRLNGMPYTVGRNPFKNDISNVSNSIFHWYWDIFVKITREIHKKCKSRVFSHFCSVWFLAAVELSFEEFDQWKSLLIYRRMSEFWSIWRSCASLRLVEVLQYYGIINQCPWHRKKRNNECVPTCWSHFMVWHVYGEAPTPPLFLFLMDYWRMEMNLISRLTTTLPIRIMILS